jgi:YVTN family beta-propeller protein
MSIVRPIARKPVRMALLIFAAAAPGGLRGQTSSATQTPATAQTSATAHPPATVQAPSTALAKYRRPYDTSTLAVGDGPLLLPYNRIIDPAGTVLRFGDGDMENHSLDAVLLPGRDILAVEDRYGVAFIRVPENTLAGRLEYGKGAYKGCMSTYSGIKTYADAEGQVHVLWSAATSNHQSFLMDAIWDGHNGRIVSGLSFGALSPSPLALPNDIAVRQEGAETYVYVVLNGNSRLVKIRWKDQSTVWNVPTGMAPYGIALAGGKIYISNWAGPVPAPSDSLEGAIALAGHGTTVSEHGIAVPEHGAALPDRQTAGIPYGSVYIDPKTGATALGTVSVLDPKTGQLLREIPVGLHPNAILASRDEKFIYVANANSDDVSVIGVGQDKVIDSVSVRLQPDKDPFIGDSPDGLVLDSTGSTLYVADGMDNAVAVVSLGKALSSAGKGKARVLGFIPTEAYPAGLVLDRAYLYVANLEGEGSRVVGKNKAYNSHREEATFSVIPLPDTGTLEAYTQRVKTNDFVFREGLTRLKPRRNVPAVPVPERIGEPSVFKHVIYIIKENRTYDQVLGDMPEGDGRAALCMYGDSITPNQHRIARSFLLLDNYYVSGKCSAEGHQWTDAGMVTDYVEKNVRAWFRSYPHVQTDALVYDKEGFIWNNALDHGKSVRVYGEAATIHVQGSQDWKDIYSLLHTGQPLVFKNVTTISRVAPILDTLYPGFDGPTISDQFRANAFIRELKDYERQPGDQWPNLMILALPCDHTAGTRAGDPSPESMVADNDLALGRIVEAVSESRFWDSTAIFVTEDDSQAGWDHVSAYRTTGFVISPYSRLHRTVHANFNQVSLLRTIEQILGIPPMNELDATALPMADCFSTTLDTSRYVLEANRFPIDKMNPEPTALSGKARHYALMSATSQYDHIDGGNDDLLNHILWFEAMGSKPYPGGMILPKKERMKDNDD